MEISPPLTFWLGADDKISAVPSSTGDRIAIHVESDAFSFIINAPGKVATVGNESITRALKPRPVGGDPA